MGNNAALDIVNPYIHIILHIWIVHSIISSMIPAPPTGNDDRNEGISVTRTQSFTAEAALRISAMLGLSGKDWSAGTPVPFGWHFPLLGAETLRANMRADGFPGLGIALPDLPGSRLVAAGRTVEKSAVLHIGQEIEQSSRIASVLPKSTAQGSITIVTVAHNIRDSLTRSPILDEQQTFILLGDRFAATPFDQADKTPPIFKTITPDGTMLFQFSALSFNSHKIHLDREYARSVEGYPDLVVNGGLTTLLMTEIGRSCFGERIRRLTVRNRAPLFCNRPVRFAQVERDGNHVIFAIDEAGRIAAEMELETDDL